MAQKQMYMSKKSTCGVEIYEEVCIIMKLNVPHYHKFKKFHRDSYSFSTNHLLYIVD